MNVEEFRDYCLSFKGAHEGMAGIEVVHILRKHQIVKSGISMFFIILSHFASIRLSSNSMDLFKNNL